MIKLGYWYIILLICTPIFCFAQVKPAPAKEQASSWLPGTTSTIAFKIENKEAKNHEYDVVVSTSSPFIVPVITKSTIEVDAQKQSLFIVPIQVVAKAASGIYEVVIDLKEKTTQSYQKITKKITIAAFKNITLTKIYAPEYVKAGDTIKADFLLENNGNVLEAIHVGTNGVLENANKQIALSPGAAITLQVYQLTNKKLARNDHLSIHTTAYSSIDSNYKKIAYANTTVLAVNPLDEDIYFRFPVQASVAYINMRNQGKHFRGFQAELYGNASLSNKYTNNLEFHIVTPSPMPFNTYSKYEEYAIAYKNKKWWMHLGDKSFSSSYLTDYARYGRGVEMHYKFKQITIGGFYNSPRFFKDIKAAFHVFSSVALSKETELSAGYYFKKPDTTQFSDINTSTYFVKENTHLPFIRFTSNFLKNRLKLSTEAAHSQSKNLKGHGFLLQASGGFEKLTGNFQWIKTTPQFNGYFKNTSSINGHVNYFLWSKLSINASYLKDARNVQRDTLFLSAPYTTSFYTGLNYGYNKWGSLSIYGGNRSSQDRMEFKRFDYKEDYLRLSLNQKIAFINLNLESQWGKTTNYLTGLNGNFEYYSAGIAVQKKNTLLSLFGTYTKSSRYQLKNQEQFFYGAQFNSRITEKSQINISYQNNFKIEEYYMDRNLFDVQYSQQIFKSHRVELSGRYALQQGELKDKDFIASVKYVVQINAPIQKIATYTKVMGRVSTSGSEKRKPIRLLLNGKVTETDKDGNFIFKNVVPGDYYFDIDRTSIAIDEIPDIPLPMQIQVTKVGEVFNFGITKAAGITGRVVSNEVAHIDGITNTDIHAKLKKESSSQVIIEISNGTQIIRKTCALNQAFDFTYLKPGNWMVKVYRNGLDKSYIILNDSFNFELKPTHQKTIEIQVVKKALEIKYQQEDIKVSYNN